MKWIGLGTVQRFNYNVMFESCNSHVKIVELERVL